MARHTLSSPAASNFAKALTSAPLSMILVRRLKSDDQQLMNISAAYTDASGNELRLGLDSDSTHLNDGGGQPATDPNTEAARQALIQAMNTALAILAEQVAAYPASPDAVFARTVTSLGTIARNPSAYVLQHA